MKAFCTYHPLVNFLYFTLVILFAMFFMHPVCLCISLAASMSYAIVLKGAKAARFQLLGMLPLLLITALINPAFNHQGVTILWYLPSGNPLTLESILYGLAAATMLISVINWFSCYNVVMTSDKFIYLFGKVIPSLSLILSMVLRFVPRFKAQLHAIADGQRCIGCDVSTGSLLKRAKNAIRILSILITWALENAIETADSMKSRGYGLEGRTAFSIFTMTGRDKAALSAISLCGIVTLLGGFFGTMDYRYFPSMKGVILTPDTLWVFAVYFLLCIIPIIIELKELYTWKRLQSKI